MTAQAMKALPKAPKAMVAYLAEHGDMPTDTILGRLVFFQVTDEAVKLSDVIDHIKELDLNLDRAPADNKAVDAFKKATSETKNKYDLPEDRQAFLLCRDVSANSEVVRRWIVREIRDSKAKLLDHHQALDLAFYAPTKLSDQGTARVHIQVVKQDLLAGEYKTLKGVATEIEQRYYRYLFFLDGMKLRAFVRDYLLKQLKALMVKPGVYFVQSEHDAELAALSELVDRFGGGCEMNMIPIPDVPRQRAFLKAVLLRENEQALADLYKEIEACAKPTPKLAANFKARLDEVTANGKSHAATIQMSQRVVSVQGKRVKDLLTKFQAEALRK